MKRSLVGHRLNLRVQVQSKRGEAFGNGYLKQTTTITTNLHPFLGESQELPVAAVRTSATSIAAHPKNNAGKRDAPLSHWLGGSFMPTWEE